MQCAIIKIANGEQWNLLNQENGQIIPEMILAKKGQLLTPSLQYSVEGIDEQKKYSARLVLQREDDFAYKWNSNLKRFVQQQAIEPEEASIAVDHIAGSQPGSYWLKNGMDFSWIKLTNKVADVTASHALVQSKLQYKPMLCLFENDNWNNWISCVFQSQRFVVVTAHHNHEFTRIKKQLVDARGKKGGSRKRKAVEESDVVETTQKKRTKKTKNQEVDEVNKKYVQEIEQSNEEDLDDLLMQAMSALEPPVKQGHGVPLSTGGVVDRSEEEDDAAIFAEFFVTSAQQEPPVEGVQVSSEVSTNTSGYSSGVDGFTGQEFVTDNYCYQNYNQEGYYGGDFYNYQQNQL